MQPLISEANKLVNVKERFYPVQQDSEQTTYHKISNQNVNVLYLRRPWKYRTIMISFAFLCHLVIYTLSDSAEEKSTTWPILSSFVEHTFYELDLLLFYFIYLFFFLSNWNEFVCIWMIHIMNLMRVLTTCLIHTTHDRIFCIQYHVNFTLYSTVEKVLTDFNPPALRNC